MKRIFALLAAWLILMIAGAGFFRSQQLVWPVLEDHFYELGLNPGYVPSGSELRPAILGFDNFAADLFWLRTVQYAGGHAGIFEFTALPEYLQLVTDLDPHFGFAYTFGALVLALNENTMGQVPGLLEKGIRMNQDTHPQLLPELYINLAFYTWFYENEYEKAARLYETCFNEIEGCPPFADKVAAFLRAKQGRFEIALQLWLERFASGGDQTSEQEDTVTLNKIEESAKLAAIDCAIGHFRQQNAAEPQNLNALIGTRVAPCPAFEALPDSMRRVLAEMSKDYDLGEITERTLVSPFDHNPFVYDVQNRRLKTRFW